MSNFPTMQERLQMIFKDQAHTVISDNEVFVSGKIIDEQIELMRYHGKVTISPSGDGAVVRLDEKSFERPYIFIRAGKGKMAAHIEGSSIDLVPYIASMFEKSKDLKDLFINTLEFLDWRVEKCNCPACQIKKNKFNQN